VRLLADEGVDAAIIARLRRGGHDVTYVAELDPGISDDAVLDLATAERRVLLTTDKDFGELVFRLRRVPPGVVLLRLAGLASRLRADLVSQAIEEHGGEMGGVFTVITPGAVRIRNTQGG
jgi:predicted nuclease of predicted toxin-antitoxin system